ncbi:hypothetical protein TNCV_1432801 [Trichonephila clavipes]|nr:hypothetical protein TNCV_1432801 [Trichonephila clavipes]
MAEDVYVGWYSLQSASTLDCNYSANKDNYILDQLRDRGPQEVLRRTCVPSYTIVTHLIQRRSSVKSVCAYVCEIGSHAHSFVADYRLCEYLRTCQVIYSQFGLAIHQNDHQARRRFVEWAQNEIAVVPDFHKRILFSDEAHFWLNGYVNKQNCRIWSEANPQVYVETPLHPEKLTVWCAL